MSSRFNDDAMIFGMILMIMMIMMSAGGVSIEREDWCKKATSAE